MAYLLGKNAKTMARLANKKLQAPSQLLEKEGETMTQKVQTNNGRIVIHDPRWYQSGANLPATQQPRHAATAHDRRLANIRPGNSLYVGGSKHIKFVGLKLVETNADASRFFSTYHNGFEQEEYHIGRTYAEKVQPNHGGGFYLYATNNPLQFVRAIESGSVVSDLYPGAWYGILRCEGFGPYVAYDNLGHTIPYGQWHETKKLACSTLIPIEFVGHWQV